MKELLVNHMYLSITRQCTLQCVHCMRGDSQNVVMSEDIIDNALKDVTYIKELQFGGGEPLLAPEIIEKVIEKIRQYNIGIGKFTIVTNGTILTQQTIDVIKQLKEIAELDMAVSLDKFHLLELYRKELHQRVENNVKTFSDLLGPNFRNDGLSMNSGNLISRGRAKKLDRDGLLAINMWNPETNLWKQSGDFQTPYYSFISEEAIVPHRIRLDDRGESLIQVIGDTVISATGYLLDSEIEEYTVEDSGSINLKDKSLSEALLEYQNNSGEISEGSKVIPSL